MSSLLLWAMLLLPYAIAFLTGFLLIPGLVYGLGEEYPDLFAGATARILWTIGMLSYGAAIIYQRAGQQFELLAATKDQRDGEFCLVADSNGEEVVATGSQADLGRLGKRPVGFAAEKSPEMLKRIGAVQDEEDIPSVVRQGYGSFNPFSDHDGWFLPLRRLKGELMDSAGSYLIDKAEEEAIVDSGGANDLGPIMFIVAVFMALLLGSGVGLVSMVVVG